MVAYDLEALSPFEFQELIGDLLQAEMGIRFEVFKQGRDSGIDLRHCLKIKKPLFNANIFSTLLILSKKIS